MFGRCILTAVAFAAVVSAQGSSITITNPTSSSWWVAGSENTLAWSCDTSPYSAYTVVLTNSDTSILSAPLALIADVPNYDCSLTVNQQQSSLAVSNSWTLYLTNIQNISDIYASTPFEVKAAGSTYPTSPSSSSAPGSGTATTTGNSAASTSTSKSGAAANYIPLGMSVAAAILLGLIVG